LKRLEKKGVIQCLSSKDHTKQKVSCSIDSYMNPKEKIESSNSYRVMAHSHIEWTEQTWNPTTGCDKVSPGCKFCYAETMSARLQAMGVPKYEAGFQVRLHEETLSHPYHWRPSVIFVNSMSDLFHPDVPLSFIQRVFRVMRDCPQHQFQVLTKRSERMAALAPELPWAPNIWMGVSVENQTFTSRVSDLVKTSAGIKFLSVEPLIGPINSLPLSGIDWVIVGGESGPKARPMQKAWVLAIRDQCQAAGVPFFFKQWGGKNKKRNGRLLDGRTYDEMPRAREAML
jgi:protein gp37